MSTSTWLFTIDELPQAFRDVTLIDVDETKAGAVAAIDYSNEYRIAFGYFRAILITHELSKRTLKLTATCLQQNPYNYTIWHYRRQCLTAVHTISTSNDYIQADLELAATLGGDNPKNYQVWYHRRALLERIGPLEASTINDYVSGELDYVQTVLCVDAKNYHAWSHRQWVLLTFVSHSTFDNEQHRRKIWESENEFVHNILVCDARNNSGWNHRCFVAHEGPSPTSPLSASLAEVEMTYALEAATKDPYNESPWVYFLAILKEQVYSLEDASQVIHLLTTTQARVMACRANLVIDPLTHKPRESRFLLGALVDILEWMGSKESLQEASSISMMLAQQHDTVRNGYWTRRHEAMATGSL